MNLHGNFREALLRIEETLWPTARKHWDMVACDCEVCEVRRIAGRALTGSGELRTASIREYVNEPAESVEGAEQ